MAIYMYVCIAEFPSVLNHERCYIVDFSSKCDRKNIQPRFYSVGLNCFPGKNISAHSLFICHPQIQDCFDFIWLTRKA